MLYYSLTFLLVALLAAIMGFSGIANQAADIAKVLVCLFLFLALISFLYGHFSHKKPPHRPVT